MNVLDLFRAKRTLAPMHPLRPYAALKEASVVMVPSSSSGRAVTSDWDPARAITDGLKASAWVYSANRFIASKISPVPWFVETLNGDTWERLPDPHPAEILVSRPNELMSGQDLIERWFYNLGLAGNALGVMTIVNRLPVEIWPLMPQNIKPVAEASGLLARYEYRIPGERVQNIDPNEIIHLMYIDPSNLYWGMSPLQAVSRVVDTDIAAINWNYTALRNRAKKDYAFTPTEWLTKEQWEQARSQISTQTSGENAGGVFLSGMPGTLTEMGMSARDLDYIAGRGMNKEEILAAYGLPEILATGKGILRNYETAVKQFWEDLAIPALGDIRAEFNHSIMPFFDEGWRSNSGTLPKLRFNYDVSEIAALQEGFGDKLAQAQILVELGYPINEINARLDLGMSDLPNGDQPISVITNPNPTTEQAASYRTPYATKYVKATDWDFEWKRVDTRITAWEDKIKVEIAKLFLTDSVRVSDALVNGGNLAGINTIDDSFDTWVESFRVIYRAVISDFGEQETERLSRLIEEAAYRPEIDTKEVVFNPLAMFVDSFINQYAAQKVALITQTTRTAISKIVGLGITNNEPTDTIARNIRTQYDNWADPNDSAIGTSRAFTIARTETGAAANWANMEAARQVNAATRLKIRKRWISSRDNRVRDSHQFVDGEEVGIEERFSNGLLYPHDVTGPAGEVINCRCVVGNVISK